MQRTVAPKRSSATFAFKSPENLRLFVIRVSLLMRWIKHLPIFRGHLIKSATARVSGLTQTNESPGNPGRFMRGICVVVLAGVVLLLGPSPSTFAQENATLSGTVRDSTGAVIPGAVVTATNNTTEIVATRVTREIGNYEFSLPPGLYTLTAEVPGFETGIYSDVELKVGQPILLHFILDVGAVTTTVMVGTRARPRSVTESTVPIDVILTEELVNQGDTDLSNRLRTIIPSYNVNTQLSDAAKISRPANLRNLAPDHTLVLVNGKRRHRSAIIIWGGNGVADGAQGPDISAIPSIALRQVEVLRDGAAAQYGSDAIAGVLNFQLKDARSGGSVEVRNGVHHDGGREGYTIASNVGLPLGATGFANLSFEYGNSNPTDRSIQRADAAALIAVGNNHVRNPAQIWGSPEIDDDVKFFGNFGYLFSNGLQFYGHTNYASKKVTGGFFFRNPNTRGGVFSNDSGKTLLIGDVLAAHGEASANCPTVSITNHVPDPTALGQVFADPNCFSFQERFPGGFTPSFGGDVTDGSVVAGLRGFMSRGIVWDASFSVGSNEADFFIHNTVNASFGPDTPTSFDPGLYQQQELGINVDVSYAVNDRVHLAGGAEWRDEQFTIGLGQRESWDFGLFAAQGFSAASNGFPGFSPIAAGKWSRSNLAVYGDVELQGLEERWNLGTAVRVENFEDFGTTVNGKLAGRFRLNRVVALRASVSSGFRAPTPGQQNAFNVSTLYDSTLMDLVNRGTIPSTSELAQRYGGRALQPEKSFNYTVGTTVDTGPFTFTADYFRIALSDRFGNSRDINLSPDEVDILVAEGITSASNLRSFRFFINDFATRTQGIDVVLTYTPPALGGDTVFSVAANHTNTDVTEFNQQTLSLNRIRRLEAALPETRWNFTAKQRIGRMNLLGRLSYYGGWFDGDDPAFYDGKPLVDLEFSLPLSDSTTLRFGSRNVFNTYPEESTIALRTGELYSRYTPWGFNGAYYYLGLSYIWKALP